MTAPRAGWDPALDAGLLSPVRAGSAAEAATSDAACLQAMLDAEAALARAQVRLGVVPAAAAEAITAAARAELFDLREVAVRARAAANPVVALVRMLAEAVAREDPDAAHYVHQGSTSQDVLDTALMLVAARTVDLILADLDRTAVALAALARRHRGTLMAARTLGQHAVPTTFGLKAAGWLQAVLDAQERLRYVREGGLPVQLGGAAGTMAGYLEYARLHGPHGADGAADYAQRLPAAVAAELGLGEPLVPWHTVRTPLADLATALCLTTSGLGTLAADVQLLSRTETAEVTEPAAEGRGASSAMPHKRNPALAALIRSAAYQVPGLVGTLAQAAVTDDERPAGAWHAEWEPLRACLRLTGGAARTAAELAEGLSVHADRMRTNLDLTGGLVVSERLAAVLSPELGRATAKNLVAAASAAAAGTGRHLADVLAEAPELVGRHSAQSLRELCDPAHYTGAAGVLVDRVLARFRETRRCD
ncbi:3-carboxy-cis,cis-muconate cycloisomerase [Streptomyces sp. NBC_00873]|uniref:3-carboxy-cis,cis-muconate cycloisomerase n=1 Tax=unclassified Streptomyces TaxID=2593676 RepID=UPI00386E1EE2|nr:3-carboxy-cis,cis-muconate cycloisomerase [Streptomyces sp. NBC_00873]WTA47525.1 3-carboxy-cis,cis-muconate cycloisomerase [Streptomyces sp. NBC_00842]